MKKRSESTKEERLKELGKECQTIGSLRGFVHFEAYLRGKEELVISIRTTAATTWRMRLLRRESTSTEEMKSPPLPPASPCARETEDIKQATDAVFLISTYATYGRPLVWLRSQQQQQTGRTASPRTEMTFGENDMPLALTATDAWRRGESVSAWEIVDELVVLILGESVQNPFAVDFAKIHAMQVGERCLSAGAMANFLWEVCSSRGGRRVSSSVSSFSDRILVDIRKLTLEHFSNLLTLV